MYKGSERRRNWVYVTDNSEYHVRAGRCVAVREVKSGRWNEKSPAVGSDLVGGINMEEGGCWQLNFDDRPRVGERLCFSSDLLTSPLRSVRRPSLETVQLYPQALSA